MNYKDFIEDYSLFRVLLFGGYLKLSLFLQLHFFTSILSANEKSQKIPYAYALCRFNTMHCRV